MSGFANKCGCWFCGDSRVAKRYCIINSIGDLRNVYHVAEAPAQTFQHFSANCESEIERYDFYQRAGWWSLGQAVGIFREREGGSLNPKSCHGVDSRSLARREIRSS